jgi:hypothetical protein
MRRVKGRDEQESSVLIWVSFHGCFVVILIVNSGGMERWCGED